MRTSDGKPTPAPHPYFPPEAWVAEFCRNKRSDLYDSAPLHAGAVNLSYFPDAIAAHLTAGGFSLEEVRHDLSFGFEVNRSPNGSYAIRGSVYSLTLSRVRGRNSGLPLAKVTSIRVDQANRLSNFQIKGEFRFHELWDETRCELNDLHSHYESCRKAAYARLLSASENTELSNNINLHSYLRKRFGALRCLIKLLEQRAQVANFAEAAGKVEISSKADGNGPIVEGASSSTIVRISARTGEFEENCLVGVSKLDGNKTVRTLLNQISGDYFCIESQGRLPLSAGELIRLKRIPRFGMRRHSICLDRLLEGETAGNWENLARLLCNPSQLPPFELREPAGYHCDASGSNACLNEDQRSALAGALSSPHAFFIQGPPGTGKTTVITELVQQLADRGERVLFLAPTHVAVDEVLRRVRSIKNLFPLRLAWDESRIREDVRSFSPQEVKKQVREMLRRPNDCITAAWTVEREQIAAMIAEVDRAAVLQKDYLQVRSALQSREDRYRQAQSEHSQRLTELERLRNDTDKAARDARRRLGEASIEEQRILGELKRLDLGNSGFGGKLMSIPKRMWLKVSLASAKSERDQISVECQKAEAAAAKTQTDFQDFKARSNTTESELCRQVETARIERDRLKAAWASHRIGFTNKWNQPFEEVFKEKAALTSRLDRLNKFSELEQRWHALLGAGLKAEASAAEEIAERISSEILRNANLICCTTTGIGGDQFAREATFDTLIVDEASRVTDSEFLIGAVRAGRWILVGDEHQLPPYVEQDDEFHLHALVALHKHESGKSESLAGAIDDLARIWDEEEEMHLFRKDAVLRTAHKLLQDGSWASSYRDSIESAYAFFSKSSDDPDRELLQTMVHHLVRSLFERCVSQAPDILRRRLTVQRRMIEPIAEIVRDPVYGGRYLSPPTDDLIACGVKPLTTAAFTKPVTFLDTSHYGPRAAETLVNSGFINELECSWVVSACRHLEQELRKKNEKATASILCFYRAQSREIRRRLGAPLFREFRMLKFEVIDAIDKIQGQESDIVFLSFCRACVERPPGPRFGLWLQDLRRLNVACTRAHRAMVFVGHLKTLSALSSTAEAKAFYSNLFTRFRTHPAMSIISDYR